MTERPRTADDVPRDIDGAQPSDHDRVREPSPANVAPESVGVVRIESGDWQNEPSMTDYRAEWLTDVLVERATWGDLATPLPVDPELGNVVVGAKGYVWARFWFRREGWLVEKYFTDQGALIGFYSPICGPIEYHTGKLSTELYGLALWIAESGRVTVLGEGHFDEGVDTGAVTPVAREQAEFRIRELTTLTAQRRFPPAFVRNFDIITT